MYNFIYPLLYRPLVGGGTGSTLHVGHYWPTVSAPGDCDDDGEFGGMKIGRGNRSTRRKPAPAPLLSTTNPTCQTRTVAVGSQRLTP
jgi:hypothetical protein